MRWVSRYCSLLHSRTRNHLLRTHLSVRLAWHTCRSASGARRTSLHASRAGIRPVQHAFAGNHQALPAVRSGREPRRVDRRSHLDRTAASSRLFRRVASPRRTRPAKGNYRHAEFCRRAHAVWESLPGRRCGTHCSSHRSQRNEPGHGRRFRSGRGTARILQTKFAGKTRNLLIDLPEAHLEGATVFLVDDFASASFSGCDSVRSSTPAGRAGLSDQFTRGRGVAGRKLCRTPDGALKGTDDRILSACAWRRLMAPIFGPRQIFGEGRNGVNVTKNAVSEGRFGS